AVHARFHSSRPLRTTGTLPLLARGVARALRGELDQDIASILHPRGPADRRGELARDRARHLEMRLVGRDTDGADLVAGDVPAAAQQGEYPARIGVLPAADIHAEPHDVL